MITLQYGNNPTELKQRTNQLSNSRKTSRNWLIISPRQIILQGMLLTGNFNIQNIHQHLSMNFKIRPYLKGQEAKFVEVFPQKGSIMRGEIKKFMVKFSREFKPELNNNGSMMLKVFVNLNTEWNKQYMITNRLRGWEEIKDLPIEEYQIPILISDEYQEIKQNIRNSVLFESEFGKVSQDLSSLYGEEKFQIPEMDNPLKSNLVKSKEKPRYSQLEPFYEKKRVSNSENKGSKSSIHVSSPKREVYFGHAPKMVQSKLEMDQSLRTSKAGSVRKDYPSKNSGILEINTPVRDKEIFDELKVKKSPTLQNPFSNYNQKQDNLFKNFSDQRIPLKKNLPSNCDQDDSSMSILKSLERQNSPVSEYKFREQKSNFKNDSRNQEHSVFKEFKTVDNHFTTPVTSAHYANKRSMELVVLAIIAGFFVALGSNIGKFFE